MSISLVLFDRFEGRNELLPLVATRPIGNLRVGAFTLDHKWSAIFDTDVSFLTADYLSSKFPLSISSENVLVINSSVLPTNELVEKLKELKLNQKLVNTNGEWIAFITTFNTKEDILKDLEKNDFESIRYDNKYYALKHLEGVFTYNAEQIEFDTQYLNFEAYSINLDHVDVIGDQLIVASSAKISNHVTLDSTNGSVIIFDHAIIESNCVIHGPTVIGNHVRVKSGTVIYPNVTVGDHSTVCGEFNNTVIWGNSAKGHYGYLGCAVIGEGCNIGAGTSNSNLKNDWNSVKLYNYPYNNFRNTGLLKCGVFIGDHSMLAISSKINTGTVIGVGAQIAISNFIPKFVPDFSWLSDAKCESYIFARFIDMMKRKAAVKKEVFTEHDEEILHEVYNQTLKLRNY